jgi:hypothetical protein
MNFLSKNLIVRQYNTAVFNSYSELVIYIIDCIINPIKEIQTLIER